MSACADHTVSRLPVVGLRAGSRPAPSVPARIAGAGAALLGLVSLWRVRAFQRRRLRELPDYLLQDMGITRADVGREATKPFWRV